MRQICSSLHMLILIRFGGLKCLSRCPCFCISVSKISASYAFMLLESSHHFIAAILTDSLPTPPPVFLLARAKMFILVKVVDILGLPQAINPHPAVVLERLWKGIGSDQSEGFFWVLTNWPF